MAKRREEERERLRQARREREAERSQAMRRRLMAGYVAAGAIALVVIVVVIVLVATSGGSSGAEAHISLESGVTNGVKPDEKEGIPPPALKVANLKTAAKKAGCVLRLHLADQGHAHIPPSAATPHYATNPPTSGPHVEPPYQEADGAYSEMPKEIFVVHSLEHGRMAIQYSPNLSEADQLSLKGLYDTMYGGTLLFPNTNMKYAVAATTWTNLLGCKRYEGSATFDAIRDFGKATWGRYGGESPTAFKIIGPTPQNPKG